MSARLLSIFCDSLLDHRNMASGPRKPPSSRAVAKLGILLRDEEEGAAVVCFETNPADAWLELIASSRTDNAHSRAAPVKASDTIIATPIIARLARRLCSSALDCC